MNLSLKEIFNSQQITAFRRNENLKELTGSNEIEKNKKKKKNKKSKKKKKKIQKLKPGKCCPYLTNFKTTKKKDF